MDLLRSRQNCIFAAYMYKIWLHFFLLMTFAFINSLSAQESIRDRVKVPPIPEGETTEQKIKNARERMMDGLRERGIYPEALTTTEFRHESKGFFEQIVDKDGKPGLIHQSIPKFNRENAIAAKDAPAHERALAYLCKQLHEFGALNRKTGKCGEIVTMALTGTMLSILEDSFPAGKYAQEQQYIHASLLKWNPELEKGTWDQTTWGAVYALLYYCERVARKECVESQEAIARYSDFLAKHQTAEGGWCHGKNNLCAAGYCDFSYITALSCWVLGIARKSGAKVNRNVTEKGLQYLRKATIAGGVGYSLRPGQIQQVETGRSAVTLLAMRANDAAGDALYVPMSNYFMGRMGQLESCHGSPLLHLFQGAVLARQLSEPAWKNYQSIYQNRLQRMQRADGSYAPPAREDFPENEIDRATVTIAFIQLLDRYELKCLKR